MATTRSTTGAKPKTASKSAKPKTTKSAASKTSAAKAGRTKSAAPKRPAVETRSVKRFDGRSVKQPVAFAFLMQQHREVESWFEQYEKAGSDEQKAELSAKICTALKVHTQIEEELLYPDAHERLADEDMVDEAYVEHDSAKALIAQIEAMRVGDHLYDAKVKVLGEYVKHHVQEEEKELFPEIAKADIDLETIGERLQMRSDQLMAEMGKEPRARTRDSTGAEARV